MHKDYTRLGGWLLLFVVLSGIGMFGNVTTTIMTLVQGDYRYTTAPEELSWWLQNALVLMVSALRGILIVLILRRNDTARFWLLGEAVIGFVANCYTLFGPYGIARGGTPMLVMGGVLLASSVFFYGIWFLYLTKSQRVAVYFHPNDYVHTQPSMPYTQPMMQQYGVPSAPLTPVTAQADAALCPLCQKPVQEGARFCGSCGKAL